MCLTTFAKWLSIYYLLKPKDSCDNSQTKKNSQNYGELINIKNIVKLIIINPLQWNKWTHLKGSIPIMNSVNSGKIYNKLNQINKKKIVIGV